MRVKAKKEPVKVPKFTETVGQRGLNVLYRRGEVNYCPGCGGTQWHVGRTGAECAYESCGLALEFADRPTSGVGLVSVKNLHTPEKRGSMTGVGVIFRQDFHTPTRRTTQDDYYANA